MCYSIFILDAIGEDEQKLQRFLDRFELFLVRQRACILVISSKCNLWMEDARGKMEVYNICTLSYVGSHRDGYFWSVFGHFANLVQLVARDCYKQKEFSDIPYG